MECYIQFLGSQFSPSFFFFNQDEVYIFERYVSLLEASDSMLAVHTFEK